MLVSKAGQLGLLLGTQFSASKFQTHLRDSAKKAKRAQRLSQLYFAFIPLVNPDRFLKKTLFLVKWLSNRWILGLILAMLPGSLYFIITGLSEMQREYSFFFNLENLLYLWATILITKLIHEFSHAYVATSFGLRVPQMGYRVSSSSSLAFSVTQLTRGNWRIVVNVWPSALRESYPKLLSLFCQRISGTSLDLAC